MQIINAVHGEQVPMSRCTGCRTTALSNRDAPNHFLLLSYFLRNISYYSPPQSLKQKNQSVTAALRITRKHLINLPFHSRVNSAYHIPFSTRKSACFPEIVNIFPKSSIGFPKSS